MTHRGYSEGTGGESRRVHHTTALQAMFTLILKTATGYTDILGHGVDIGANQWPTESAAEEAAADLRAVGIGDRPGDEWRVVNVQDLGNYELTA